MGRYKVTLSFEVIVTCYDKSEAESIAQDNTLVTGASSRICCDSVEDRLPDDFEPSNGIVSGTSEYQVYDKVFGVSKAWLKKWDRDNSDTLEPRKKGDILWEHTHYRFHRVTHWQPLPPAPTK